METLAVLAALFVAQFVKGVIGFGSALVAIPLISLILPTPQAIALTLVVDVLSGLYLVYDARDRVVWPRTGWILLAMLPGQWVGTGLLQVLDPPTVSAVLAVVVAALALRILRGGGGAEASNDGRDGLWGAFASVAAGLMQGLVGMPGPPLATWVQRYLPQAEARATLLSVFLPAAITTLAMMGARDMVQPSQVAEAVLMSPASLIGGFVGSRVAHRLSVALFRRAVALVLMGSAAALWMR